MGFFDFLRRSKPAEESGEPVDRKFASLAKTAASKRAQAYDRDEAIRGLIEIGTPQAAAALLKRFALNVDPSITDQEEKDLAYQGIVRIGQDGDHREAVVEHVRQLCQRAESYTWPLKVLRALLDDEAYERELLQLLAQFDTEYTRNQEPKINLISEMETLISPAVREAVERYLDDVNETVRFHAVETTFKQGDPVSLPALVELMENEESVRIKNKIAEGMIRRGWDIPEQLRERFGQALEDVSEYKMTKKGKIRRA